MSTDEVPAAAVDDTVPIAPAVLEQFPVELAIEVASFQTTADEVQALSVGRFVYLQKPAKLVVDVLANRQRIAQGELVEVEGELALRITAVNPRPQ